MNYYEMLGISRDATFDQIKEAYFERRKYVSGKDLDILEMAYRTLASADKRAKYDEGILSHQATIINNGEEFGERLYRTLDPDKQQEYTIKFDKIETRNIDDEESQEINLYHDFEKEVDNYFKEETLEEDTSEIKLSLTPTEVSRALAELVKDDGEEYIEGTNVIKPRNRNINETDEEYENYLEKYYDEHFYIPGTDILKPRDRKDNETDEEYDAYLEAYYAIIFADKKEKEEQLEEVTKREKHPRLKKILTGLLIAGGLVLGILGIRSCSANKDYNVEKNLPGINTTVDDALQDVMNSFEDKIADNQKEQAEEESIDVSTTKEVDTSINVGDKFNLNENNLLYTASTDNNAKSSIGTTLAPAGEYTIDKIVVLDSNNHIIANSSFGEVDLDNYDNSYKKMFHFSRNVTAEDIESGRIERDTTKNVGWVFSDNVSIDQKVGTVIENVRTR